jgi:8-amino-7-oxononanoate synthase
LDNKHQFLQDALDERNRNGRLRKLRTGVRDGSVQNFCTNDYLNLSAHPRLKEEAARYTANWGTGSTASRLISGTHTWHIEAESKIARFFGYEEALLFNSGFQANISILQALASRDTVLLFDRLNHNSLIQGARLSGAKLLRYNHCDAGHLRELLDRDEVKTAHRRIIVTESVFSMDGDRAPVPELIEYAAEFDALLMVDEAHAIGILGDRGTGIAGRLPGIDLYIGTFGKAGGGFGAFVCCSRLIRDYLVNFASGFIYSTAPPPAVVGASCAAIDLFPEMDMERERVEAHSVLLRRLLNDKGIDTLGSDTHIIPVLVGPEEATLRLSSYLEEHGMVVVAIRPPTVPAGQSRLRISLNSSHTESDIAALASAITGWFDQNKSDQQLIRRASLK